MNPQAVASSIFRNIQSLGSNVLNSRTNITSKALSQALEPHVVIQMRQQGAGNMDAPMPRMFTFGPTVDVQETDEIVWDGWVWVVDQATPRVAFGVTNRITVVALRTRAAS